MVIDQPGLERGEIPRRGVFSIFPFIEHPGHVSSTGHLNVVPRPPTEHRGSCFCGASELLMGCPVWTCAWSPQGVMALGALFLVLDNPVLDA